MTDSEHRSPSVQDSANILLQASRAYKHSLATKDTQHNASLSARSRLEAPTLEDANKRAIAVYLYEKQDEDDYEVTPEKIFGACVFYPENVSQALDPDEELNAPDLYLNQEILKGKTGLDRKRILTSGKMSKGQFERGEQHVIHSWRRGSRTTW
ncbi:hypothetical protein NMY22_g6726 [Coprinellus aureogranulatus]|nr:hypothetical protein NMY22_g6726 [Coprinellus aureogranulatus]